jgi:hypothetical protein
MRRRRRRGNSTDTDGGDKKDGDAKRKGGPPMPVIAPGSNGWLCEWPSVEMEFFIYPKTNNSLKFDPSGVLPSSLPTATTFPTAASTSTDQGSVPTPYYPGSDGEDDLGPPSGFDMPMMGPKMLSYHPKVIKIRERRNPEHNKDNPNNNAVCRLIKVRDRSQGHDPVVDPTTGQPIVVTIAEKDFDEHEMPGEHNKRWVDSSGSGLFARENPNAGLCGCIWVLD